MSARFSDTFVMGAPQLSQSKSKLHASFAIRHDIIDSVAAGRYEEAITKLKNYLERDCPFPSFRLNIERYVSHCIDLILAIQSNRNFANTTTLTKPKQQELRDKFKHQLDELKSILNKIEVAYNTLHFQDSRSTKYVVQALFFSMLIVFASAVMLDTFKGAGETAINHLVEGIDLISDKVHKLF